MMYCSTAQIRGPILIKFDMWANQNQCANKCDDTVDKYHIYYIKSNLAKNVAS